MERVEGGAVARRNQRKTHSAPVRARVQEKGGPFRNGSRPVDDRAAVHPECANLRAAGIEKAVVRDRQTMSLEGPRSPGTT